MLLLLVLLSTIFCVHSNLLGMIVPRPTVTIIMIVVDGSVGDNWHYLIWNQVDARACCGS